MDRRTDRLAAVQVDLAVNVATVFGLGAGVRVLHAEGISPAVVQRVIIDGGPRRGASETGATVDHRVRATIQPQSV